jgi:hypothetical protein
MLPTSIKILDYLFIEFDRILQEKVLEEDLKLGIGDECDEIVHEAVGVIRSELIH